MQTNRLETCAPRAGRDFIAAVTHRAALFGLTAERIAEAREEQELAVGWVERLRNPAPSPEIREAINAYLDKLLRKLRDVRECRAITPIDLLAKIDDHDH